MTAIDPATCWVPVPVRWRYVQPGDVIAGKGSPGKGSLWMVSGAGPDGERWRLDVSQSYLGITTTYGDPDEMVSILVPVPERDARSLVLGDLATHVIGRRTVGAA
jgi:hypothetical protein